MRVHALEEAIVVLDDSNTEVMRVAYDDPMLNFNLNAVIAGSPELQAMYNHLVLAAQVTKVATLAQAAIDDSVALRAKLDELAFNEFVAKEGSTAAVLKARLH